MKASFSRHLYKWYDLHKRHHPWLGSKNAYHIWLSEVIMQQTRIQHGTAYYLKFIQRFPTIHDLASASEDEVLKMWEGLGYYSRARNMLTTAKEIRDVHEGKFPQDFETIIQLKGIGKYTASAILSFAFKKPFAVIDGNVLRILARIFGLHEPIDSTEGKKKFDQLAQRLIDTNDPGKHNQAIMDFGALVCTPDSPQCNSCPFSNVCYAFNNDLVEDLPVRIKKPAKKTRYFNYLVITDGKKVLIEKRSDKDIWRNLYQFPLIISKQQVTKQSIIGSKMIKQINRSGIKFKIESVKRFNQELTHQKISASFYLIMTTELNSIQFEGIKKVTKAGLKKLAFPGVIREYLKEITIFNS